MTSFSDLATFQRCPQKYYYRVIENIEPSSWTGGALNEGTAAHEFLAGAYRGDDLEYVAVRLMEMWRTADMYDDDVVELTTTIARARSWVEGYTDYYGLDEWEILSVEESFQGEHLSYTPDLIVRDWREDIWIVDHKTTQEVPTEHVAMADLQALSYFTEVSKKYDNCKGFIFNYIRKKTPTVPRLNKTGPRKVNNLARIDTTFQVLRNFLINEAPDLLDDPEHRQRLAELKDVGNRFYFRDTIRMDEHTAEFAELNLQKSLELLNQATSNELYPRVMVRAGMMSCERCPYLQLCRGELLGSDVRWIRDNEYKQRVSKDESKDKDSAAG